MKLIVLMFFIVPVVCFAQTKKDTVISYKNMDTTGVEEFGGRIYDVRIGRFLPVDTAYDKTPCTLNNKKKKRKHK